MAFYLTAIELENEALSKKNPEFNIGKFTEQLFAKLTKEGQQPDEFGNVKFSIELFPTTFFHFNAKVKQKGRFKTPPEVRDLDVPVFTDLTQSNNLEILLFGKENELLIDRILPRIDGFRHTLAIATESKVDVDIVKMVLQHLFYYGLIKIIDLFRFSNSYKATHKLCKLANNPVRQQKCKDFMLTHLDGAVSPQIYSQQL